MDKRRYNIEHRKKRSQYMVYEEQISWIKRNCDKNRFKSESDFVTYLLSLGIQKHVENFANVGN